MQEPDRQLLGTLVLELRHLLEGQGEGDLYQRARALGLRVDDAPLPVADLPGLTDDDRRARELLDAHVAARLAAGESRSDGIGSFVREAAYGWANRLLALRCMEARELIDEVIEQKEIYGGRSLEHHRFARRHPELCTGEDDGLYALLEEVFAARAEQLPALFRPADAVLALRPSVACLQRCVGLLGGRILLGDAAAASTELFRDPATLGWAYQYWNAEQKERVFAQVRSRQAAKIGGADIVAATQLYTASHLVRFLTQNSLGALWLSMHPDSALAVGWPYRVRQAIQPKVTAKSVADIRVLDPACGSGHFLLEAFDMLYAMYEEEGVLREPDRICRSILEQNLFGIDIDERAVQIAAAALWMKAADKAFDLGQLEPHLVAADIRLAISSTSLASFLEQYPEHAEHGADLSRVFEGLASAGELGSLLRLRPSRSTARGGLDPADGPLFTWAAVTREATRLRGHLVEFLSRHGRTTGEGALFFQRSVDRTSALLELVSRSYDVILMNPPYAGFRTLAPHLKTYLHGMDEDARLDLYVAFISRFFEQLAPGGLLAAITPASWTTSSRCVELRRRVLREGGPVVMAALGQRVFETAPLLFVSLSVLRRGEPPGGEHFITLRPKLGSGAAGLQRAAAQGGQSWPCRVVAELDAVPFLPVAPLELLETAAERPPVGAFFDFVDGVWTGGNERDIREAWEIPAQDPGWVVVSGGQGYARWYGPASRRLRARFAESWPARTRRHSGLEYARVAGGRLCARVLPLGPVTSHDSDAAVVTSSALQREPAAAMAGVVSLLPQPNAEPGRIEEVAAVFNSRVGAVWVRTLASGLNFNPGYAARIPLGEAPPSDELVSAVGRAVALARALAHGVLTSDDFDPSRLKFTAGAAPEGASALRALLADRASAELALTTELLEVEHRVEQLLADHLGLSAHARQALDDELGRPVGALPVGPPPTGATAEPAEAGSVAADRVLPVQSELERQCRAIGLHPRTLLAAAESWDPAESSDDGELVQVAAALRKATELRLLTDYLTTLVLRVFEHRWPLLVGDDAKPGDPARSPSIVSLVEQDVAPTAIERIRELLLEDFGAEHAPAVERTASEYLGRPLEHWLSTQLFKHHVKQFRRRPVVWQLQSARFGRRRRPVFACWLYALRIDRDTLTKIRSQYLRPLRQQLERQCASLEGDGVATDPKGPGEQLRASLAELDRFDEKLEQVSVAGFRTAGLEELLAAEPMDRWVAPDAHAAPPTGASAWVQREQRYRPEVDDGVRVNVAPLQRAGLLAAEVLAAKDVEVAIADRAQWRSEARQRCRDGEEASLPWWDDGVDDAGS